MSRAQCKTSGGSRDRHGHCHGHGYGHGSVVICAHVTVAASAGPARLHACRLGARGSSDCDSVLRRLACGHGYVSLFDLRSGYVQGSARTANGQ